MTKPKGKAEADQSRAELGQRIGKVAEILGTRVKAAEAAGISTDQLARYILGTGEISLAPVARMAARAGVSLDWIARGIDPMMRAALHAAEPSAEYRATKADLLEFVMRGVDDALDGGQPERRALFISLVYDQLDASNSRDPTLMAAIISKLIKLTAKQPAPFDIRSPDVTGKGTGTKP